MHGHKGYRQLATPAWGMILMDMQDSFIAKQYLVGERLGPAPFAGSLDILLSHQQPKGLADVRSVAKPLPA